MDLGFLKTLSPLVLKSGLISAVATIAIGLGFRIWRPEAALQTPDYVLVFLICFVLVYGASRILPRGSRQPEQNSRKAPPAEEK
jgi:hypothetical protein